MSALQNAAHNSLTTALLWGGWGGGGGEGGVGGRGGGRWCGGGGGAVSALLMQQIDLHWDSLPPKNKTKKHGACTINWG